MSAFVSHTTIDCRNAYRLSQWWKPVLDYSDLKDDPNSPGDEECLIRDPEGDHAVLFIEVPDPTPGKNRMHFDIRPRSSKRDDEVRSLLAHGATLHEDHCGIYGPGSGWVTLADPEGNLFCVLNSEAERGGATRTPTSG